MAGKTGLPKSLQNAMQRRVGSKKVAKHSESTRMALPSASNPNTNKSGVSTYETLGNRVTSNGALTKQRNVPAIQDQTATKEAIKRRLQGLK